MRRSEAVKQVWGMSVAQLVILVLSFLAIGTMVILGGIALHEIEEIEERALMQSNALCAIPTPVNPCDDKNDCTLDFVSQANSVCAPTCNNKPLFNGAPCADACLLPESGVCNTGECHGACAGSCVGLDHSTCPEVTYDASVVAAMVAFPEINSQKICYGSVCWYVLGPVDRLLFRAPSSVLSEAEGRFELAPHMDQLCAELLNSTATNVKCLQSFYNVQKRIILTKRQIPVDYQGSCFYRYSCANTDILLL